MAFVRERGCLTEAKGNRGNSDQSVSCGFEKLLLKIFRMGYAPKTITDKGLRVNGNGKQYGFEGILGMRIISPEVR